MSFKCFILRVYPCSTLPSQLLALLEYTAIYLVRIGIRGDLSNIGRDFHCISTAKSMKCIVNLGKYTKARKVIKNSVISL